MERKKDGLLPASDQDYFDLIDIFAFVWKARFYILACALIGFTSGRFVADKTNPPVYVTSVPVKLDRIASPANTPGEEKLNHFITERELSAFNELVSDSKAAGEIYDHLEKIADDEVRSALVANDLSRTKFIGYQLAGLDIVPIRLFRGPSPDQFVVQSRFKISDSKGALASAIVRATSQMVENFNRRMAKQNKSFSPTMTPKNLDETHLYRQIMKMRLTEEFAPFSALYKLEESLAARLGAGSASFPRSGDGDHIIRFIGLLISKSKMSENEAKEIREERATLIGEIDLIRTKYSMVLRDAEIPIREMSLSILQQAIGGKSALPTLLVDEEALKQKIAASTLEQYQAKRALFSVLGLVLGSILGVLVSSLKRYIYENRKRILAIFKS